MLSKTSLGVAAGATALGFIGYCIYFDHKRRSDPLFKQKLRERRKKDRDNKRNGDSSQLQFPSLSDPESIQRYFVQEIQLGEDLIAKGDINGGVEHLAAAAVVSGEPNQLLALFQRNLPPQVYQLLTQRLHGVSQRFERHLMSQKAPATLGMMEEDLE